MALTNPFTTNKTEQTSAIQSLFSQYSKPKTQTVQETPLMSVPVTTPKIATPKVDTKPTPVKNLTTQNTVVAPVTNTQASNSMAAMANQIALSAAQKPVEAPVNQRDKALSDIMALSGKQAEQGKRTLDLQEENRLAQKQAELNKINSEAISVDRAYENRKRDLLKNPEGKLTAQLNNEVNQLDFEKGQRLADIGIRQAVAQGNVELANKIVETAIKAEFEPLQNQIDTLKSYYQMAGDNLTARESKELDAMIRKQEADYQFGLDNRLLEKKQQYELFKDGLSSFEENKSIIPALQDKVGKIDTLLNNVKNSSAVGTNPLARTSLTNWMTGNRDNFIASVEQLVSADTLSTLINLKKAGGTLGALSEGERQMLQSAATKIGTWRMTDENGKVTGYKTSEKFFADELKTIKMLTNRAIKEAGGDTNEDPLGLGVKDDPLNLGI